MITLVHASLIRSVETQNVNSLTQIVMMRDDARKGFAFSRLVRDFPDGLRPPGKSSLVQEY